MNKGSRHPPEYIRFETWTAKLEIRGTASPEGLLPFQAIIPGEISYYSGPDRSSLLLHRDLSSPIDFTLLHRTLRAVRRRRSDPLRRSDLLPLCL